MFIRCGVSMCGNKLVHPLGLELQPTMLTMLEVANLAASNDLANAADSAAKLSCHGCNVEKFGSRRRTISGTKNLVCFCVGNHKKYHQPDALTSTKAE